MMSPHGKEQQPATSDSLRRKKLDHGSEAEPLQLMMLGDCMLGRMVNEVLESQLSVYPWGDTLQVLKSADWRMCNLECVISDRGMPWSGYKKAFCFRSAAKNIAVLEAAQMNAVSLANNHTLDYGYEAMFEMLDILNRAGIAHSGAGANLEDASRVVVSDVRGKKVGLLAFTDNEPSWEAKARQPGVFYVPVDLKDRRAHQLLEIVRAERNALDLLIISAHWGGNWGYTPEMGHVPFAHALIEAGASVVFGHSCHVFRGIEFYQGRLIFYSAGDFVDDYAVDRMERNDEAFIYILEALDRTVKTVRLVPTLIRSCQARRAQGIRRLAMIETMQGLCHGLGSKADWNSDRQWLEISPSKEQAAETASAHP